MNKKVVKTLIKDDYSEDDGEYDGEDIDIDDGEDYIVSVEYECSPCHFSCESCTGGSEKDCLSCKTNHLSTMVITPTSS